jgi:ketosteroid isomerase-like protein
MLEAYRRFVESAGGGERPAGPAPPLAPTAPEKPGVPSAGPGTSWLPFQSVAWAEESDGEEAAIRALLTRYGAALTARNVDQVASIQPGLTDADRQKLATYFQFAPDLEVQISDVDVLREGDEAVATYTRRDRFTDSKSRRQVAIEATRTARLKKTPGGDWAIIALGDGK